MSTTLTSCFLFLRSLRSSSTGRALGGLLLGLMLTEARGQFCGTATNMGVLTPTATVQNAAATNGVRNYWTFSATAGTVYNFNTCAASSQDTYLRIYSTPTGGTVLASNDDGCGTSRSNLTWTAAATGTYSVLLTRVSLFSGNCLALNSSSTLFYSTIPDPCSAITPLAACGTNQTASFSGSGAGWSVTSCGFSTPGQERIYSYTPVITGVHSLQVTSATGGYVDYFWKLSSGGCSSSGWTCIDDINGATTVNLPSWTAGVPVLILLDPEGTGTMSHTFRINCAVPPPANDACANAITIPGSGPFPYLTSVVNNTSATDAGDPTPSCQTNSHGGIWYNFTPACSGNYRFSTCPGDAPSSGAIDHILVVATGACGGSLSEVACSDDVTTSVCASDLSSVIQSVALSAGTTYRIFASTFNTVRGNIQIQTRMVPPTIASFSSTTSCSGGTLIINGTNLGCATAVTIGGTPAIITGNTASSVTVTVGAGTTGPVIVSCAAGTVSSAGGAGNITVGQPVIASFNVQDDCANGQFSVQVNVSSLGSGSTANLLYTVNGTPTYVPGMGTGTTSIGPFAAGSEVICTVDNGQSTCPPAQAILYSSCPVIVPCGTTLSVDHCYRNNDARTFTFSSSNPSETVTVTFVSGTMGPNDVIRAYSGPDNSFPSIPSLTGNFPSLANATGSSTSNTIFIEIDSDASNSCATGQQSSWAFEVECTPGCVDPDAAVMVNTNCAAYNFNIDVEVLFTGDAPTTTLHYTVNGGPPSFVPGLMELDVHNIGPFAMGDQVNVRLLHENNAQCDRNLGVFTNGPGCPSAENCVNALNLATQTSPLAGTTVGRTNEFSLACGTASANSAADAIYYMDVPNGAEFHIRQQSNTYDSQHYVRYGGACPGSTVIACVNDDNGETGWVDWTNTTGSTQRVYWIQDGVGSATGTYMLQWQLITCPVAPPLPTAGVSTYTICQNGSVPAGQGLTANCASVPQSTSVSFPGGNFISEGTTLTTRATLTVPALPAGAVVTAARLKLFNVVANTAFFGLIQGQRQNIRVALAGAYTLAETQLTTATGAGTVTPNPVIVLSNFPAAGGTIDLRTRQTADQSNLNPDATIGSALIEVDYSVPTAVRWYGSPAGGTLLFTGTPLNPVSLGLVNPAVPGTSTFYATCGFANCENIRLSTTFKVNAAGNAGSDGTLTLCSIDAASSLFAQLGGTPQAGGTWSGPSPVSGGMYDPATMVPGVYTYTVVPLAPCAPVSSTVTVTENTAALWYADLDGDGAGDPNASQLACAVPPGHVASSNDGCPNDANKIAPGACGCGVPDTDTDGDATADCNDGCPNDPEKIAAGACGCGVPDTDTDGDATADCNDGCPNDPNKIAPGACGCGTADVDGDFDGVPDCLDACPTVPNGIPGQACNDGNPLTYNDLLSNSPTCGCAGTACTATLTLEFQLDGVSTENWEIRAQGTNTLIQSGAAYLPVVGNFSVSTCVPDGCFYLKVTDDGGDGLTGGGYSLRLQSGKRIIDNRNNFLSGTVSQIAGNQGWCITAGTIGNDRLITASCDRLDLQRGANATCSEKLTADNTPNNTSGSVYQFWVYNPNGPESQMIPATGAGSNILSMNQITLPAGKLYNVRVRTRISPGVYRDWGPACRMSISPTPTPCRITKLVDDVSSVNWSCGKTVVLPAIGGGSGAPNMLVAKPATRLNASCVEVGANKYQFRIKDVDTQVTTVVNGIGSNYYCYMTRPAFGPCRQYEVDVRCSFDNGTTWCAYSDVCTVYTGGCSLGNLNMAAGHGDLHLYPNPNRGDQVMLHLENIDASTVNVDIYDAFGKRVIARTLAAQEGFVNQPLELNGELAAGLYVVNITAGEITYTERLVIEP